MNWAMHAPLQHGFFRYCVAGVVVPPAAVLTLCPRSIRLWNIVVGAFQQTLLSLDAAAGSGTTANGTGGEDEATAAGSWDDAVEAAQEMVVTCFKVRALFWFATWAMVAHTYCCRALLLQCRSTTTILTRARHTSCKHCAAACARLRARYAWLRPEPDAHTHSLACVTCSSTRWLCPPFPESV